MKTFSKDSLKVGDRVIINHLGGTHTVCEVCDNSFAVLECGTFEWNTYAQAIEEGWTILPDEEEKVKKIIIGDVNKGIIKNNEELIRQINSKQAEDTSEPYRIGLCDAMAIIQSKNDSLSKE